MALVTLGIGEGLADLALVAIADGLPGRLRLGRARSWPSPPSSGARRRPAAIDQLATELRTAFLGASSRPHPTRAGDARGRRLVLRRARARRAARARARHVLGAEAPLDALAGGAADIEALVAVGVIGVVAFLGARLVTVSVLLDVLGALRHSPI